MLQVTVNAICQNVMALTNSRRVKTKCAMGCGIFSNAHNCQFSPKCKSVTMAQHVFGSLLGLENFYSGCYCIGVIQLIHRLSTLCHCLSRDEGCKAFLTATAIVWWFIKLIATHYRYKMVGNGCPFIYL